MSNKQIPTVEEILFSMGACRKGIQWLMKLPGRTLSERHEAALADPGWYLRSGWAGAWGLDSIDVAKVRAALCRNWSRRKYRARLFEERHIHLKGGDEHSRFFVSTMRDPDFLVERIAL